MKKLKILIINPPVRLTDKPRHIPHGLAILANLIRRKIGVTPVFLDINAHRYSMEKTKNIIRKISFDIALIGGIATIYKFIVEISDFIKKHKPDSKIITGGYVTMATPQLMLDNSKVDIVCCGEGEITLIDILKRFHAEGLNADLSDMKGICYRQKGKDISCTPPRDFVKNLDEESIQPAYDLLPMDIYLSNPVVGIGRDIDMITIRGCPFRCSFCYQPYGHKPRAHTVGFIVNTVKYLQKNYSIDFVSFQDDEFMSDRKRIVEFCKRRNESFPDILWSCTGRANIIAKDEDIVKMMRNSGCVLISCGFESGSERMLKAMHKAQNVKTMEKAVKVLRKYEMPVPASFIIGLPGENEKSCQETLDFSLRNNLPLDSLMFATPYPGSELFDFALETKRIDKDNLHNFMMRIGDARDFLINLTDSFSDEELISKRKEMIRIAQENYQKYITREEIIEKTKNLFGYLVCKAKLDEKDLEHRTIHGGMSTF